MLRNMTVEQLAELHAGDRQLTDVEAKALYDMIHQTEVAKVSFELHGKEPENAKAFAEKHKKCYSRSATSEKFQYTFVPGGIGTGVSMKCLICGEESNITDYDIW
jgi:uncharacterized protein CbrC (UPF0167 family)